MRYLNDSHAMDLFGSKVIEKKGKRNRKKIKRLYNQAARAYNKRQTRKQYLEYLNQTEEELSVRTVPVSVLRPCQIINVNSEGLCTLVVYTEEWAKAMQFGVSQVPSIATLYGIQVPNAVVGEWCEVSIINYDYTDEWVVTITDSEVIIGV